MSIETIELATAEPPTGENRKRRAALAALDLVQPGMKLGLGTGSTANEFVQALGAKVASGLDVICVPTSERTAELATSLGIALTTLEMEPSLDLTVDGADELDRQLRLTKGGGGALLREKIVATASKQMVVIADDTKLVDRLGAFPLPIEIVPFGLQATRNAIDALADELGLVGEIALRLRDGGGQYVTDGGHFILDAALSVIPEPELLAHRLDEIAGVVGHGLFIGIASEAMIADPEKVVRLRAD